MHFCLPATGIRIWLNTDPHVNNSILEGVINNIRYYMNRSKDEIIERQLELDEEWDIERVVETGAGALTVLGALMTWITENKGWAILMGVSGALLLQHALHGRTPVLSCIRKNGIRTQTEIMAEKTLLEVLKEDPQLLTEERIREIVRSVI
jgi:hypothetical protein